MLQACRVILKRREQISHGRISRITRLGKEAQVGQLVFSHKASAGHGHVSPGCLTMVGMQRHQCQHGKTTHRKD